MLSIHKWVHLCLLVSYKNIQLYYDNDLFIDTFCTSKPGLNYIYNNKQYIVTIGGIDKGIALISRPISAKIADVQIYKTFLSLDELNHVTGLNNYNGVIKLNKSDVSKGVLINPKFLISNLFESPTNITLLVFNVEADYARAVKTCISHGAQLPKDLSVELITMLVNYALKTQISVSTAWLSNEHKQSEEMSCDAIKVSDQNIFKVQYKCDDYAANVACIMRKGVTMRLIGLNSQIFSVLSCSIH